MPRRAGVASGVVEMLKEDHKKVKELFEEFESARRSCAGRDRQNRYPGATGPCRP